MTWKSPKGQLLYRIGDVIISTNSENPANFFGGTWQLLCPGRTLVCIDSSDNDFNTPKKIGGSKYLQSHSHSGIIVIDGWHNHSGTADSAGYHNHEIRLRRAYKYESQMSALGYEGDYSSTSDSAILGAGSHTHSLSINGNGSHSHGLTINSSGNGNAQNLQPFMAVYMW